MNDNSEPTAEELLHTILNEDPGKLTFILPSFATLAWAFHQWVYKHARHKHMDFALIGGVTKEIVTQYFPNKEPLHAWIVSEAVFNLFENHRVVFDSICNMSYADSRGED